MGGWVLGGHRVWRHVVLAQGKKDWRLCREIQCATTNPGSPKHGPSFLRTPKMDDQLPVTSSVHDPIDQTQAERQCMVYGSFMV